MAYQFNIKLKTKCNPKSNNNINKCRIVIDHKFSIINRMSNVPISGAYKTIANILANRLKLVFSKIISNSQMPLFREEKSLIWFSLLMKAFM